MEKRLLASENHFFKPLPLPRHQLWKKRKKGFSANKNHLFQGVAFPSTNFADTSKRMTFSKQKSPFQILAPSNHPLWKNKHQTIFRIRNSLSQSIFIPDNRCVQAKSKQLRPYVGHICESYRFSSLSFCLKIKLKDTYIYIYINSKCQYPRFLHNLKSPIFRQTHT